MNIKEHNKRINDLRKRGLLKPLGMTTRSYKKSIDLLLEEKRRQEPQTAFLTEGGSLLPNKYAYWPRPFSDLIEKDY